MDDREHVRCGGVIAGRCRVGTDIPTDVGPATDDTIGAGEHWRVTNRHDTRLVSSADVIEACGQQRSAHYGDRVRDAGQQCDPDHVGERLEPERGRLDAVERDGEQ